ncbi:MAG: glycosyltransferase family 4 protein [Aquamicrobium sp.]|uniref:glycosyltransferase family 4 protein n=1 Tax=Aquamicrobium sp. TaxID=1872579 RepID=UPI00349E6BCE|nr:glycosyltransferase family 4 protein [Aquamicrobium sp.]
MATSLRIVHCFRAPVGGVFRHVRDLAVAQAAAGHQVGFICDSTTGGALEDRYFDAIAGSLALGVTRMPIGRAIGPGDIAAGWRTYRLVKQLRPDVLHGHGAKGGALARIFGSALRVSRFRVARLYSPHGGVLHFDPATVKGKALFALERLMDRMSDRFLFVSEFERRTFAQKIGGPKAPSEVIYNGLGPAEFDPVPPAPDAADFLYIGEMRALKGTDIFIDALDRASTATGRPLTAVMVGSGEVETYAARIERLGLGERIRMLPPMPAREAFALARLVVVPSRAEAMPYIVLEALAAGKPMIAAAVGGIPEIFGPTSPALVAPDVEAVAAAMARAIRDEAAHAALMPARDDLRGRFGVETMAARVEAAYRLALAR